MPPSTPPTPPPPLKPPGLKKGDLIGVVSPAGPVHRAELEPALDMLRSSGFRVRLGPHVYDRSDYLAGEDRARLSDLHSMFRSDETRAVFCARGGYGTLRLLQEIDYDLIGKHPRIIVGYSDITALLMAINRMTGLVVFHGPVVRGLDSLQGESVEGLFTLLSSKVPASFNPMKGEPLVPGRAEGPLIGGNLSLLCHLAGTPFFPSLEGAILFVEDRGEPLYRIDRMLTHLTLTGRLKGLTGLMGGQFTQCGDETAVNGLLRALASDLDIPLVTGFPAGHGPTNLTLPMGLPAVLDTASMTLTLREPCVS